MREIEKLRIRKRLERGGFEKEFVWSHKILKIII